MVVEVLGKVVLIIPNTVRFIMNKGRAEGQAEGMKAERERTRLALREARARGIAPDSPELEQFLLDFDADKPDDPR